MDVWSWVENLLYRQAKANGARPEDFRHDYGKAIWISIFFLLDLRNIRIQRYIKTKIYTNMSIYAIYIQTYILYINSMNEDAGDVIGEATNPSRGMAEAPPGRRTTSTRRWTQMQIPWAIEEIQFLKMD